METTEKKLTDLHLGRVGSFCTEPSCSGEEFRCPLVCSLKNRKCQGMGLVTYLFGLDGWGGEGEGRSLSQAYRFAPGSFKETLSLCFEN